MIPLLSRNLSLVERASPWRSATGPRPQRLRWVSDTRRFGCVSDGRGSCPLGRRLLRRRAEASGTGARYRYGRRHWFTGILAALAGFVLPAFARAANDPAAPGLDRPFGPHVNLTAAVFAHSPSFSRTNRIVGTYYFYWYDSETGAHIVDDDGTDALTTHPPTLEGFSYKSVAWHQKQLSDMMDAGIDLLLPVFWGAPSDHPTNAMLHWSYAGLPPLVAAREQLEREGRHPPRIGLFYDTSTLQYNHARRHVDLTTDAGRQWFYATIRDFFSLIPPRHWAMIDDRPIVLLYASNFARNHDQACIDYVAREFPKEFGGRRPWIVREISWRVQADDTVAWGGALGLKNPGVASLGPGYDHSAVPGRTPLVVDRQGGRFYEQNWLRFLRRPSSFVMLETWNEFHEGTDIAESREYGRQYLELTRKYVDLFKAGWQPSWPTGRYTSARAVDVTLGATNTQSGLRQIENEDGVTEAAPGPPPSRIARGNQQGRYVYFAIDDTFKWANTMDATVEVEYRDLSAGSLGLEYDGSDASAPFQGAYTRSPTTIPLRGDGEWKSARFTLPAARLLHSQNREADFRLVVGTAEVAVRRVTVIRPENLPDSKTP